MTTREHNEKTPQELYEDQQFIKGYSEIKGHQSDMAGTKADMGAVYKRLKDIGWSKVDVKFAQSLEDKDVGQVIADFERKIRIARMLGHRLGRQLDILNTDNATEADRAYEEGRQAGLLRKGNINPYQIGSEKYDAWQKGNNDGHAFINQDLKSAVSPQTPGN